MKSPTENLRDRPDSTDTEIEITPAMIEAGVDIIHGELSGAPELPPAFDAVRFAKKVFSAMDALRPLGGTIPSTKKFDD